MQAITNKILTSENKIQIQNIYTNYLTKKAVQLNNIAYEVRYVLTDEEMIRVQNRFKYVPIRTAVNLKSLKISNHPEAAVMNDYAYDWFTKYIRQPRNYPEEIIELGADPRRRLPLRHNCYLLDSTARNRYIANTSFGYSQEDRDMFYSANTKSMSYVCDVGCQNCNYPCDTIVSINSVYDISFDDIYRMFIRHNNSKMIVWMYMPPSLYDQDLRQADDTFYNITYRNENGIAYAYFSLHDQSFIYKHRVDLWSQWFKITKIEGNDFDIAIERKFTFGSLVQFSLIRVPHERGNSFYCELPFANILADHVKLPDLLYYIGRKMTDNLDEIPYIVVPKNVVTKVRNFSQRQLDGKHNFTSVHTVAATTTNQIIFGEEIAQIGWKPPIELFEKAVMIMFIQGAIARWNRTQTISKAFKEMDHGDWFEDFSHYLKKNLWDASTIKIEDALTSLKIISRKRDKFFKSYVGLEQKHDIDVLDKKSRHTNVLRRMGDVLEFDNVLINGTHVVNTRMFVSPIRMPWRATLVKPVYNFPVLSKPLINQSVETLSSGTIFMSDSQSYVSDADSLFLDYDLSINDSVSRRTVASSIIEVSSMTGSQVLEHEKKCFKYHFPLHNVESKRSIAHAEVSLYDTTEEHVEEQMIEFENNENTRHEEFAKILEKELNVEQAVHYHDESIFVSKHPNYVHCVAADGKFSGGIAPFMNQIAPIDRAQFGNRKVGDVLFSINEGREVYWLITKKKTTDKPVLSALRRCLMNLITTYSNDAYHMPMLGCGLDGLSPSLVHIMLTNLSKSESVALHVYLNGDFHFVNGNVQKMSKRPIISDTSDGHCLLHSFIAAMSSIGRNVTMSDVFFRLRQYSDKYMIDTDGHNVFKKKDIEDYIRNKNWMISYVDYVPFILSDAYKISYTISSTINGVVNYTKIGKDYSSFGLNYNGSHYTFLSGGIGTDRVLAKYQELIDCIKERKWPIENCADISAAPGMLGNIWDKNFNVKLVGYIFNPDQNVEGQNTLSSELSSAFSEIVNYKDLNDLSKYHNLVICDAANKYSEGFYGNLAAYIKRIKPQYIMIKLFAPAIVVMKALENYVVTPYRAENTSKLSGEQYIFCEKSANIQPIVELKQYGIQNVNVKVSAREIGCYINEVIKGAGKIPMLGKLRDKIKKFVMSDIDLEMKAVIGYAGTGKTSAVMETYGKNIYYGSGTTAFCDEMKRRGAKRVFTMHRLLLNEERKEVIAFDECQMQPLAYFALLRLFNPDAEIIAMGDLFQISHIDYSKSWPIGVNTSFKELGLLTTFRISHRCPQDVVIAMNRRFNLEMETTSKVVRSVYINKGKLPKLDRPVMVMNRQTKDELVQLGHNVYTVHEAEGSTYRDVAFYTDDIAIETGMNDKVEHVYVKYTRHDNMFVEYGNSQLTEQIFNIDGHSIQTYEELTEVRLHDDVIMPFLDRKMAKEIEINEDINIDKSGISTEMITDIIRELLPPVNECFPLVARFVPLTLPAVKQGRLIVKDDVHADVDADIKAFKIAREFEVLRQAQSKMRREALETVLARYARKTKSHKPWKKTYLSLKLVRTLSRMMYGKEDYNRLWNEISKRSTDEKKYFHYKEYLIALQKKIGTGKKSLITVAELQDEINILGESMEFFNKKQGKFDPSVGFDTKIKAGQGVMAWKKKLNCIYAAYSRMFLEMMMDMLPDNIIIATGERDDIIGDKIASFSDQFNDNTKHFKSDAEQWDGSYNDVMIETDIILFKAMGMHNDMIQQYRIQRVEWRAEGPDFLFYGMFKQHSGQPFTFSLNTLLNMMIINTVFRFEGFVYGVYKGDDSDIACESYRMHNKEFMLDLGHNYKTAFDEIGEFAGMFITKFGFFPDIFRRLCKFLSKDYHSKEHLEMAKLSVDQDMRCIGTYAALEEGVHAAAIHYRPLGMTPDIMRMFVSYANKVHEIQFADLELVNRPTFVLDNSKY